jgi:threonine/homoserine/homoserine lactone efflux protein
LPSSDPISGKYSAIGVWSDLLQKGGKPLFDLANLGTFVAVVIGLFLIPGPAVLLTITRTVQSGRKAGMMASLGIATGDFIHTLLAAIGLSALLMTSALAFNLVKYAGAAYLIYLGVRALLERPNESGDAKPFHPEPASARESYLQAILAEVLNPKTALFFLALLPQFVHPAQGAAFLQFLVLGFIFCVLSVIYTTMLVLSVDQIGRWVKRFTWLNPWKNKILSAIYFGLGLKVALESR